MFEQRTLRPSAFFKQKFEGKARSPYASSRRVRAGLVQVAKHFASQYLTERLGRLASGHVECPKGRRCLHLRDRRVLQVLSSCKNILQDTVADCDRHRYEPLYPFKNRKTTLRQDSHESFTSVFQGGTPGIRLGDDQRRTHGFFLVGEIFLKKF